MNNLVLELLSILVPTPCASMNISFEFAMDHLCPLLLFRRAGSLSMRPVAGSTAVPENREVLVLVLGWLRGSCASCLASITTAHAYLDMACDCTLVVRCANGCVVSESMRARATCRVVRCGGFCQYCWPGLRATSA